MISSRSNSASPPSTVSMRRPCGVVVSAQASPNDLKAAPALPTASSTLSRSRVERASRRAGRVASRSRAGMNERDLHFHDLRGTAATKFYIAGLSIRVIAEILAWSEDQVERIIRRYVARSAATKAAIQQLNLARTKT